MPEMGQAGGTAVIYGWDGSDPQRIYAGALAATIAATQYALDTKAVVYGYDGSTYRRINANTLAATIAATQYGLVGQAVLYAFDGTTLRRLQANTLAATIAATQYGLVGQAVLYGFDGTTLSRIKVEDSTNPNLRAAIYDAGNKVVSDTISADNVATTKRGLYALAALYGYDGSTWDRVRLYPTGILKVARAEAGLSNSGVLSTSTAVKASAGKVYWISLSDTAALAIALNDSTAGGGTDRWGIDLPADGYGMYIFDPPIEFSTGIYLSVNTATCKVTIGYL